VSIEQSIEISIALTDHADRSMSQDHQDDDSTSVTKVGQTH